VGTRSGKNGKNTKVAFFCFFKSAQKQKSGLPQHRKWHFWTQKKEHFPGIIDFFSKSSERLRKVEIIFFVFGASTIFSRIFSILR